MPYRMILALLCLAGPLAAQSGGTWTWEPPQVKRPAGPPIASYAPFTPPEVYRTWFAEAEYCTGRSGDFDGIVWLQAPGKQFMLPAGVTPDSAQATPKIGLWKNVRDSTVRDTIVIAAEWLNTRWLIKHEVIHYLTQQDHPKDAAEDRQLFGVQCRAMWGYLGDD